MSAAEKTPRLAGDALVRRDAEIARRWLAGESQARLGRDFGLTDSGVHRVLARIGTAWRDARAAAIAAALNPRSSMDHARKSGRKAVWPDCPPELQAQYRKIRSVIGSEAAKAQLLSLHTRQNGSTTA